MLEYFYADESSIPAEHKALYENRDGGWFLKVKGVVPRTKLEEFRTSNDTLKEEVKQLKASVAKFDGVDVDKYHDLLSRETEINEGKLIKAGKVEEVVEQRLAGVKAENERQLKAAQTTIKEQETKIAQMTAQLKKVKIENTLLEEARKRGLKAGAEKFLLAAAERDWDLDDKGHAFVKDSAGKTRYGANGDAMQPGEWMDELTRESGFMFEPNGGSGAGPKGGQGGGGGGSTDLPAKNPWKKEHWNTTEQMKIYGKDKALAERMAAAAGVKLTVWAVGGAKPADKAAGAVA